MRAELTSEIVEAFFYRDLAVVQLDKVCSYLKRTNCFDFQVSQIEHIRNILNTFRVDRNDVIEIDLWIKGIIIKNRKTNLFNLLAIELREAALRVRLFETKLSELPTTNPKTILTYIKGISVFLHTLAIFMEQKSGGKF